MPSATVIVEVSCQLAPVPPCLHGCQRNCGGSRLGTKVATSNIDDEVPEWEAQNVVGAAADVIE
jgi:hypothetical protein